MESVNQKVKCNVDGIELFIKRGDLLNPAISGNKFRKLKYNLKEAREKGFDTILTFGGAHSNHIAATASAGKQYGFKTIGIIRGSELSENYIRNETLAAAAENGMLLEFIDRESYRAKSSPEFLQGLRQKFGSFYLIPEGGTNALAVHGCEEILTKQDLSFNYICCSVGTGGTISGIINGSNPNQKVLGFPALKGDFLKGEITKFARGSNWELIAKYHFGGYAKTTPELITFMNSFYLDNGILLDPVYTGKMIFGVTDMISEGYFPNDSRILMIHTGGLQGIAGMNQTLMKRKQTLIAI